MSQSRHSQSKHSSESPSSSGHRADNPKAHDAALADEAAGDAHDPAESPEQLVDALEQQVVELRDRELKAQAELENFRRRIMRDVETQLKFAALPMVSDLLEVVDNLQRATDSCSNEAGSQSVVQGVRLVQQQLAAVLTKHHCHPIESVGKPFDPNVHQAIAQQPSSEYAAGVVMLETSVGYRMHDRVVRPSMVIVSTGPSAAT